MTSVASATRSLTLVLPAYNPGDGWERRVLEFSRTLQEEWTDKNFTLIICTDGSSRGHSEEVRRNFCGERFQIIYIPRERNRGKGYTVREGVKRAYDIDPFTHILVTDWDIPFSIETYRQALRLLAQGAEVVVPLRDESYTKVLSPRRKMYSLLSKIVNRGLLALPVIDTQGGLKAMSGRGIEAFLRTKIETFLYDTEFVIIATKMGIPISSLTAAMTPGLKVGNMKYKTLWNELKNLPYLITLRWWSSASM